MDGTEARKIQMHVSAAPFVPREGKTRVMAEQHKDNSSTKARGHSSSQAVRRRSSNGRERSEKPNLNRGGGRGKGKNKPSGEVYDHTQNTGSNSGASRALTPKKNATKRYEPLPFSRERFVQANFSFCIRRYVESPTRGDDRDIFLSWETIETVIVLTDASSSQLNCPICLDKFLAPKMTSCGHVYCYLCMLKFMSYSVDELCRCPLCANSVAITDLKSVEFREIIPCHENQEGTMRLLARPKDSIIPEPFDPLGEDPVGDVPIYNQQQTPFARYLYTNEDHYLDILEKEANDIATALNEAEDRMHMNVFAEMAKASIRSTRSDVKRRARANRAANRKQQTGEEGVQRKLSEELVDPEAAGNSSHEKTQNSIKYIYQAASGENIYLHPLNVKCLTYEFQNFREFPLKLNGKICEIERSVVTDEVKRRYNFLSHLPVGCEFGLCELDLSPILQPETLKAFESDFRARREARQRRHKQAKRENAERRKSAHIYKDFDSLHQSLFSMPLPRELESTDISDLTSFPTLGVSPPNSNPIHDGASEQGFTDGAPVVAEGEPHSPEPTISSYASITRNMGFFPNLQNNEGLAEADIGESEYPALGGSSSSSAVGQGAWGNKLVPLGSSKSLKKKSMTILSTQQMWPR